MVSTKEAVAGGSEKRASAVVSTKERIDSGKPKKRELAVVSSKERIESGKPKRED